MDIQKRRLQRKDKIGIYLRSELKEWLKIKAVKEKTSVSSLIEVLVEKEIEKEESDNTLKK